MEKEKLQFYLQIVIAVFLGIIAVMLVVIFFSSSGKQEGEGTISDNGFSTEEEKEFAEQNTTTDNQPDLDFFNNDVHLALLLDENEERYAGAYFEEVNENSTQVTITFENTDNISPHAVVIHSGNCDNLGNVEYDLGTTSGQHSVHVFNAVFEEFTADINLAMTLTPEGESNYVACGNT